MQAYPMTFRPILRSRLWGGRRLAEWFGKPLPGQQPYGESWEVCDVPGESSVIADGPAAGRTLAELMARGAEALLGAARPAAGGRFPLLVKLLDCRDRLSVQVHPDAAAAAAIGGGARTKTEAWVVLHADPAARIWLGLKPGVTRGAFAAAIANDTVEDLLHVVEPTAGDCFYIPSGTVHALGAGLVVAEVQETSDTTYRAYDWGRAGLDGRPRQLHVEEALASIRFDASGPPGPVVPEAIAADESVAAELLMEKPFARIRRLMGEEAFDVKTEGRAAVVQCLFGAAEVRGGGRSADLRCGGTVLLPAAVDRAWIEPATGGVTLLVSQPT
jgi:mannose-6-phosphate isomerase